MTTSAVDLVRELGYRWADMSLSTPTSIGGVTTLIDAGLDNSFPNTTAGLNVWVYGGLDVPANNVGVERRSISWSQPSHTLVFAQAWPDAIIVQGTYEVYRRCPRGRLVSALNAAISQLGLYWFRAFIDTSIRTVEGQYRYALPSSQNWSSVNRIEIEGPVAPSFVGYPYAEIGGWGIEEDLTGGVRTLYLQFSGPVPAGQRLRIHGEGFFPKIEVDTDTLEYAGPAEGAAVEWIWDFAEFKLDSWQLNKASTLDQQKGHAIRQNKLLDLAQDIKRTLPSPKNTRVLTPLSGDGRLRSSRPDPTMIGAGWSLANH